MPISCQVLGTGAGGIQPSLLLICDGKIVLFDVPEGLTRLCMEHKIHLGKLDSVFFTQVNWDTVGGVSDLLMTIADFGKKSIRLLGPLPLTEFCLSTQMSLWRPSMTLEIHEFCGKHTPWIDDEQLRIVPLLLTPSPHRERRDQIDAHYLCLDYDRNRRRRDVPSFSSPTDVCCYAVHTPDLPGKFDVSKATALGIPKGPLFAQLVKGLPIQHNGREIRPEEVVGPPIPGAIVLIVVCPTVSHVPLLVAHTGLQHYRSHNSNVRCVFHVTPREVVCDERYIAWLARFSQPQHIFVHATMAERLDRPLFLSSNAMLCALHAVLPPLFPLPVDMLPVAAQTIPSLPHGLLLRPADNMLLFVAQPASKMGIDTAATAALESGARPCLDAQRDFEQSERLRRLADAVCAEWADVPAVLTESTEPNNDIPYAVFLGTAAASATKYRNEGAIYLHLPPSERGGRDGGGMLLDAGGGTYTQMVRRFGWQRTNQLLQSLRCVWITHKHGDHCAGIIQVLRVAATRHVDVSTVATDGPQCNICGLELSYECSISNHRLIHLYATRPKQPEPTAPCGRLAVDMERHPHRPDSGDPLLVVGPMWIEQWLRDYSTWVEPLQYRFVDAQCLTLPGHPLSAFFSEYLGIDRLLAVPVDHSFPTYAVVLHHRKSDLTLVYSGDTRPCARLEEAGRGATVLIHEGTFEDDNAEKAVHDNHSTIREALGVAARMQAQSVVLTHFSNRLETRVPDLWANAPPEGADVCARTVFAFDLMTLPLLPKALQLAPKIMPILAEIFRDLDAKSEDPHPTA